MTLRCVDLFAGLGGCHITLARLGHSCAFAALGNAVNANLVAAIAATLVRTRSDVRQEVALKASGVAQTPGPDARRLMS